jgi:exopolysaccharide biosynthesis WecB/TagA/CpsF family protein
MITQTIPEKQNLHHKPRTQREFNHRETETEIVFTLGLPFHQLDEKAALSECERLLDQKEPKHIVTANADFVAKAWKSPELKRIIVEAHRVLCDGQPIVWMSKLLGCGLPGRVTGSDLTPRLLELVAKRGDGVFIFGTDEKTLESLSSRLKELYPGLNLVGAVSPPYGSIDSWDNQLYIDQIQQSGANLLLVCLGFPKQDVWIDRYLAKIGTVSLAIGIGASLDFIAGKQIRAPRIFRTVGMEWFWRLLQNPRRMLGRYIDDFFSIAKIGSLQLKSMWFSRKESGRKLRLLNGIGLPNTMVIESSQIGAIHSLHTATFTESVVMDFRSEERVTINLVRDVIAMYRFCQRKQIKCCLFNAPRGLIKHLAEMQFSRWIPSFYHSSTVKAWTSVASGGNKLDAISISVLNRLDHEVSAREFYWDIVELLKHAPGQVKCLQLDLANLFHLSVPAAVRLISLQKKLKANELENSPAVVNITNAKPEVLDVLDILGLMNTMVTAWHDTLTDRKLQRKSRRQNQQQHTIKPGNLAK